MVKSLQFLSFRETSALNFMRVSCNMCVTFRILLKFQIYLLNKARGQAPCTLTCVNPLRSYFMFNHKNNYTYILYSKMSIENNDLFPQF